MHCINVIAEKNMLKVDSTIVNNKSISRLEGAGKAIVLIIS